MEYPAVEFFLHDRDYLQGSLFSFCQIGIHKQDIVDISEKIDTYETSILPYEDCCTIFVAKHPVTKPKLEAIEKHEHNLDEKIDELMKQAIDSVEIIKVK